MPRPGQPKPSESGHSPPQNRRHDGPHEGGWAAALDQVGSCQGSLLTQSSGVDLEYGCLSDCLRASYTALGEDDDDRP